MTNRNILRTKTTAMVVAGMAAAHFSILAQSLTVAAQTTASKPPAVVTPKFDVSSVKPCQPGGPEAGRGGSGGGASPGTLRLSCVTVSYLIRMAYVDYENGRRNINVAAVPTEGGPSWMNSDRYEIDAK